MDDVGKIIKCCKEYIDLRVTELEKHVLALLDLRILALKEATTLAREGMELRLNTMNEFRDSLKDQSNRFHTKGEQEIFSQRIMQDIDELKKWKNQQIGKADQSSVNIALAISLLGLVLSVLGLILNLIK